MLLITARNLTIGNLEVNGLADYDVWVGVNHDQIWAGKVSGHVRADGAQALLRRIADAMELQVSAANRYSPVDEALVRGMKEPRCPKCGSPKLSCEKGCTWEISAK
jgi:hypothetical protein